MRKPRIIFMGTPELGSTILEKLITSRIYAPELVITQQDKPVGRAHLLTPPPVRVYAESHTIEVWQPTKLRDQEMIDRIRKWAPDIIIIAAYGKIIPQEIIDIPTYGILNVHTSLLPRHRGASPIQSAILSGDQETGVTIMRIDAGLDTGPIVSQRSLAISPDETTETLTRKLAACGADLLIETLPQWLSGEITSQPQQDAHATLTKIFKKEDGEIHKEHTAEQIERMIRALTPWPGVFITLRDKKEEKKMLKILRTRVAPCIPTLQPLTLSLRDMPDGEKELILHTEDGCLMLDSVQPEGKNPMSGHAFWLGYRG
ncbi:MAG: methionyl-tRNA formyltransferase [Candidatus Azambacteria bacterium]|nr:methionyl-tRNA formyltransferase [Candidatus Azambacteria bacterium]